MNLATEFATGRDSTGWQGAGQRTFRDPEKLDNPPLFRTAQDKPGKARSNFETGALNRSATHPGFELQLVETVSRSLNIM